MRHAWGVYFDLWSFGIWFSNLEPQTHDWTIREAFWTVAKRYGSLDLPRSQFLFSEWLQRQNSQGHNFPSMKVLFYFSVDNIYFYWIHPKYHNWKYFENQLNYSLLTPNWILWGSLKAGVKFGTWTCCYEVSLSSLAYSVTFYDM